MKANYFLLEHNPRIRIYNYRVDLAIAGLPGREEPEGDKKGIRKELALAAFAQVMEHNLLGTTTLAFDGAHSLYTTQLLDFGRGEESKDFEINLPKG